MTSNKQANLTCIDWPLVASTKHSPAGSNTPYDIPWIHTYDDHEISNDWSANTTTVFPAAFDGYLYYHLAPNPPLFLSASATPQVLVEDATLPSWSTFTQGPASFFVLDTRRYRSEPNPANGSDPDVSMLGMAQLFSLLTWLTRPPPPGVHWKFVVSSVPFTKNWRNVPGTMDTWSGYVHERDIILRHMWKAATEQSIGIVVLSGDRHEFAATAFPPTEGSGWPSHATVHEFSCSPLNMFYLPIRTYVLDDHDDIAIKYSKRQYLGVYGAKTDCILVPDGNTKFGAISISKETKSGQSLLTYRLFVDGEETWSHFLTAGGDEVSRHRHAHHTRLGLGGSQRFEQLRDAVKGGREQVAREGSRLVQDGEELIGRREETAGEHVGDVKHDLKHEMKHKMEEVGEKVKHKVDEKVGEFVYGTEDHWVGRSDRWRPGWGEHGHHSA